MVCTTLYVIKKPKLEMQHYCSFLTLLQSNMNGHQKWANVYAVQRTSTLLLRVYVLVKYLSWWLSRILLYYLSTFLSPQKSPTTAPLDTAETARAEQTDTHVHSEMHSRLLSKILSTNLP